MKELRKGYTTGTCAAIATKAACRMIFEKKTIECESIVTPKGTPIKTNIYNAVFGENKAECAVKKDSGDDPDITDGILVYSNVILKTEKNINVDGGKGIGRVTKIGLKQEIGKAAINEVPLMMIKAAAEEIFDAYEYEGGADIIISIPEGENLAKKTFNPRLGIDGGLSILGTSGIVEPMSERAIIETIKAELTVKRKNEGDYAMIAPGNYGIDFIRKEYGADLDKAVKCSNFVGEALDFAVQEKFKGIVLIGHIGKFIKLAGGIMNTHSRNADSRMEILAANAAYFCEDINTVRRIADCLTTDEAVAIIKEKGILTQTINRIVERAAYYVNNRVNGEIETAIIIFSNVYGILGKTKNADDIIKSVL